MNAVWVVQEHLMAHWCQAMAHYELGCVIKKGTLMTNLGKSSPCFKV
jgi:hypothetical protein